MTSCLSQEQGVPPDLCFFLLLSQFVGPSLGTLQQKATFALSRIFVCLLSEKKRCVPCIQLNCRTSLSLGPAPPSSDEYCNFIWTPVPTHAQHRSTDILCKTREKNGNSQGRFLGRPNYVLGAFYIFWPVRSSGKPWHAKCWLSPSEFTESYGGLVSCARR